VRLTHIKITAALPLAITAEFFSDSFDDLLIDKLTGYFDNTLS